MSKSAIAKIKGQKYETTIKVAGHEFIMDEPVDSDGQNLGPNPSDLLKASLAACTAMTMKMYAERKGWDMQDAEVEVEYERDLKNNITSFSKKVHISGDLTEEQRKRIFEIGGRCPIHRIISNTVEIDSALK